MLVPSGWSRRAFDGVGELDLEDLAHLGLEPRVEDGEGDLDAVVEVARHPVGGGEEVLGRAAVLEVEDPGVLEEAVDDRDHADALGQPRHAGPQAADAAHDEVDLARRPGWPRRAPR